MKIDASIASTIAHKPRPKMGTDKNRWRDIGDGMIECESTKRVARLIDVRGPVPEGHTVTFTHEQWAKLERIAAWRTEQTNGRVPYTPEQCLAGFIDSALDGPSGWKHPSAPTPKK